MWQFANTNSRTDTRNCMNARRLCLNSLMACAMINDCPSNCMQCHYGAVDICFGYRCQWSLSGSHSYDLLCLSEYGGFPPEANLATKSFGTAFSLRTETLWARLNHHAWSIFNPRFWIIPNGCQRIQLPKNYAVLYRTRVSRQNPSTWWQGTR
jgi:hypothetical protein